MGTLAGSGIGQDDAGQTVGDLAGESPRDALVALLQAFDILNTAHRALRTASGTHDPVPMRDAEQEIERARDLYQSAHDRLRFLSDRANQESADRHATALNRATEVLGRATIGLVIATVILIVVTALT